jgi:hypothetical protein
MDNWQMQLKYAPIQPLLNSDHAAIRYFVKRDLLKEPVESKTVLWQLPEAKKILNKQLSDGSWSRPGEKKYAAINYNLIETWRQLRYLIGKYDFNCEHPQIQKAAEFVFSCQTEAGDIRGFLANQYATYYTGAMLALLIQAGYEDDPRVEKGLQWLLKMRQNDHGWTIPILTRYLDGVTQYRVTSEYTEPIEPDRSQPFSHNWTGMILRAFVAHPDYRHSETVVKAAELLKSRFFQPDSYTSYQAASYWVRFDYPFWWNHLVAALDSISWIGFSKEDEQIKAGLNWLIEHQECDGMWKVNYGKEQDKKSEREQEKREWISLAISRIFERI